MICEPLVLTVEQCTIKLSHDVSKAHPIWNKLNITCFRQFEHQLSDDAKMIFAESLAKGTRAQYGSAFKLFQKSTVTDGVLMLSTYLWR